MAERDLRSTKDIPLNPMNGQNGNADDDETVEWRPSGKVKIILVTLASISFIIAVDAQIVAPALATLAEDFNATSVATFWTGTSFLLAHAVFVPVIGALSDIFGRRELLLTAITFFTVGTIVCCTADNIESLLIGRTIKGVGGGGIQVMSMIVLSDLVPLRQRAKYASFIILAWALGAAVGPLMGGGIVENTTWRWIFYINFPFCAVGFAVIPFTLKLKPVSRRTFIEKILAVDWLGAFLLMAGTASFLIGLTWAGVQYDWDNFRAWLPILLGGLAIIACVFYELWVPFSAIPFLRLGVFSDFSSSLIFFSAMTHGLLMFSHLYYIPFYLQSVQEQDSIMTGVAIMANNLCMFPSSSITGIFITRLGKFTWAIRLGFALATLGNGLLLLFSKDTTLVEAVFIVMVHGVGQGCLINTLNIAAQAVGKNKDSAYSVTMFMFMRSIGMCLGVALGGTVVGNTLLSALNSRDVPNADYISEHSEEFVHALQEMEDSSLKDDIVLSYVDGFYGLFYILIGISGLCLLLSFLIEDVSLDKQLESGHKLEKQQQQDKLSSQELQDGR